MKRHLTFLLIAFLVCFGAKAQVEKTNLRVLYVSGHSDIETMGMASYDTAAYDKSVVERAAAWEQYLNQYFTTVKAVRGADYNYRMSYDYDVTVIDGTPQPVEPRPTSTASRSPSRLLKARW